MNLKEAFKNCLSGDYSRSDCRYIIDRAHTIALAYLRMKASSGHLYLNQGEPLEDLAWDFIADLFERNRDHSFTILNSMFMGIDLDTASAEEIEQQFRRIIVTKIDDNIFRSNGEKDPSLKKIIRNLKNALQNTPFETKVVVENGYISVGEGSEGEDGLPVSPSEILEIQLCRRIRETMQTPDILLEVINILEEFQFYQKKISLVAVAISIRKAYVHIRDKEAEINRGLEPEENLYSQLLNARIERDAEKIKLDLGEKYVRKRVLTRRQLSLFMLAAKEIVRSEFIEKHAQTNHFECLKQYYPNLEYEEYRETYRSVLEYLVKKTRAEIINFYEKEWK